MEEKDHVIEPFDDIQEDLLKAHARARGISVSELLAEIVIARLNGVAQSADRPFFDCQRFSKNLKH